jgi:hypothetical protein
MTISAKSQQWSLAQVIKTVQSEKLENSLGYGAS